MIFYTKVIMDRLRELNVKQLTSLLSWYRIRGRSRMTTREAKIQALNNIPEVINNAQQIADNRREIFREIGNMPRRRANQPQLPLPIPRNRPNLPPLNIPQPTQIPGTPPGSPDRFIPETPPGPPPSNKPKRPSPPKPTRPPPPIPIKPKKQVIKNELVKNTKQTPFLGNVLNKFWDFVKPYIPEKVKNKTEELAKNFIDRYKKANEINQPQNRLNRTKSKRDYARRREQDQKQKG